MLGLSTIIGSYIDHSNFHNNGVQQLQGLFFHHKTFLYLPDFICDNGDHMFVIVNALRILILVAMMISWCTKI